MLSTRGLTRREWLRTTAGGLLAATTGCLTLAGCGVGNSDFTIPNPGSGSPNLGDGSGTPRSVILQNVAALQSDQRCLSWCWAACAETVVKAFGGNVYNQAGQQIGQEYFATKLFGAPVCQAATPAQLAAALDDTYRVGNTSQVFTLRATPVLSLPLPRSVNQLAAGLLKAGIPFITEIVPYNPYTNQIADEAHYLIIYGMDWYEDSQQQVTSVKGLYASDPFRNYYPYVTALGYNISPPPTYLDASIYTRYQFIGQVTAVKV